MRICPQCRQRIEERICPHCEMLTVDEQLVLGDDLIGKVVAGRYQIESMIAKGGMGAVYKATHIAMGSKVALKVLRKDVASDLEAIERFYREARAVGRLTHVNTIKVFDFGQTEDGRLYIAMEYLEGWSLREEMKKCGRIAPIRICHISAQVCKSLSEAHQMDPPLIHRDIKPENIFLTRMGKEKDFVKLLDFGIAKAAGGKEDNLTQDGTAMGTPRYMSPEQARGAKVDPRSDLYSLGVVMYEMAAGSPPFEGTTPMRLILAHINDPPPPLQTKCPDVPVELANLIMSLLEKNPNNRPRSADELLARIVNIRINLKSAPHTHRQERIPTFPLPHTERERERKIRTEQRPITKETQETKLHGIGLTLPESETAAQTQITRPVPPVIKANIEPTEKPKHLTKFLIVGILGVLALIGGILFLFGGRKDHGIKVEGVKDVQIVDTFVPKIAIGEGGVAGVRWIHIRGGSFMMGDEEGEPDEVPVHQVTVNDFQMTKSEITVAQYRECVLANACPPPFSGEKCNFGVSGRERHPMNCVDWHEARTFCKWIGGRLPSEAEWEYVAKGGQNGWKYPWGNNEPTCERAVFEGKEEGCAKGNTAEVCSKPLGNTEQGLCDMAGNVWEWVEDLYMPSYEGAPNDGSARIGVEGDRVSRGGGYNSTGHSLRSSNRMQERYTNRYHALGFRCARDYP